MIPIYNYGSGIFAIDAQYERPLRSAIHFVVDNGRAAIIDAAHNASVELTVQAVAQLGLKREDVDYVCLTHIHLDHAGGAGALMREFANARLVVHPRGARHMAGPAQLMAGVKAVYGEAEAERLYGELVPVPEERILAAADDTPLKLGNRELRCLDTPGHARHHLSFYDTAVNTVFTGDAFGVSCPELDVNGRQFVIVSSSPVQFDPRAMHDSIRRILAFRPEVVYLTHFSQLREPAAHGDDLHRQIDAYIAIAEEAGPDDDGGRCQRIASGLGQLLDTEWQRQSRTPPREKMHTPLKLDIDLNARGLDVWLKSRAKA